MSSLYHAKLGGGYTQRREIIIDAADMSEYGESGFEVAALTEDGDLETEEQAKAAFDALIQKYAGPLQRTIASADLQPGGRYTLVFHNEFGFPIAQRVTFCGYAMRTYAQHSDVVQLKVVYRREKKQWLKLFIGYEPLLIFKGWQELPESAVWLPPRATSSETVLVSKCESFSNQYIEDALRSLKAPVVVYRPQ
nr:MAG TPA: hypothetical protein [Caudoviricetes sp.]